MAEDSVVLVLKFARVIPYAGHQQAALQMLEVQNSK